MCMCICLGDLEVKGILTVMKIFSVYILFRNIIDRCKGFWDRDKIRLFWNILW